MQRFQRISRGVGVLVKAVSRSCQGSSRSRQGADLLLSNRRGLCPGREGGTTCRCCPALIWELSMADFLSLAIFAALVAVAVLVLRGTQRL